MGCVASKLEEEEEVVSICRERKRLIKLAVDRRQALAEAHCRYCQAMYAVAASIKLFVACHSSPSSPFLITFPPPCPVSPPSTDNQNVITTKTNPMFLQQTPSESKTHHETAINSNACESCDSSSLSSETEDEEDGETEVVREETELQQHQYHHHQQQELQQQHCGYFYMQMPPPIPSPSRDFGWDFFNPFDVVRPEILSGYNNIRCSDEDLRAVREEEGIPELEEEGEGDNNNNNTREEEKKVVFVEEKDSNVHSHNRQQSEEERESCSVMEKVKEEASANVSQGEQKGLTVIDSPEKGRELLEALKDIEDHFIRAYDSGKDVSRMLEANMVHLQSGLEEIKGGDFIFIFFL